MCVYLPVFGSYIPRWRLALFMGKSFADGFVDSFLNSGGFSGGRTAAVIHTRPCASNIGLCTLARLFQIGSLPHICDGAGIAGDVGLVAGSRTVSGTLLVVCLIGSSTGR